MRFVEGQIRLALEQGGNLDASDRSDRVLKRHPFALVAERAAEELLAHLLFRRVATAEASVHGGETGDAHVSHGADGVVAVHATSHLDALVHEALGPDVHRAAELLPLLLLDAIRVLLTALILGFGDPRFFRADRVGHLGEQAQVRHLAVLDRILVDREVGQIDEIDARLVHFPAHEVIRGDEELVRIADFARTDTHEDPVAVRVQDRLAGFRQSQDDLGLRDFRHIGLGSRFELDRGGFFRHGFAVRNQRADLRVRVELLELLHVLDLGAREEHHQAIEAVFADVGLVPGFVADDEPVGVHTELGAELLDFGHELGIDRERLLRLRGFGTADFGNGVTDGDGDGGKLLAHDELLVWGLYPYLLRTFCLHTPEVECARGLA